MIDADVISEAEFQRRVIAAAVDLGWDVYHQKDSRAVQGGELRGDRMSKGWPDLVLVRERILFRELKRQFRSELTKDQARWLAILRAAGQDAGVWRPRMYDEVILPELS